MAYKPMDHRDDFGTEAANAQLNSLFQAYREACPEPEPGVNFMPAVWAKIEARQKSTTLFSRMARALVGAALAATVILGMMLSKADQSGSPFDESYLEAMTNDHVSTMDVMNLDRISEMEQQ